MANQIKTEKNKMNPILWFLFAIIIPIIVAVTLAFIIFSVAGFNVAGWAKNTGNKIPVISSFITSDEEKSTKQDEEKTKAVLASKDDEIQQLTQNVSELEGTIERLQQEIIKLEKNSKLPDEVNDPDERKPVDSVKSMSSSFKDMDNKQAALIIENMDKASATSILKAMSNKMRGNVLGAMEPKKAAELTQLIMNEDN